MPPLPSATSRGEWAREREREGGEKKSEKYKTRDRQTDGQSDRGR